MTSDLLWPGMHRAGDLFTSAALAAALVRVEGAWCEVLESAGLAPAGTASAVRSYAVPAQELPAVATEAEGGGNPVIPVLARLREHVRAGAPEAAGWVHAGLTSQDVLDTALVLSLRDCLDVVAAELDAQVAGLAALAQAHRDTLMVARTLGQPALPTTFGARVAGWLRGLLAARSAVLQCRAALPVQAGGAAGTLAATAEVCRAAGSAGSAGSAGAARRLVGDLAALLGLRDAAPWHTDRSPVTGAGDALVRVGDALGHLANDIVLQCRPEIGELSEAASPGRGGSSAMPQKRNPVLAVLLRRHAQSAPLLGAQLHLAAAGAVDERPDGAWHTEWAALGELARRTVVAARQASDLLAGLEVHPERMRQHLDAARPAVLSERAVPVLAGLLPGGRVEAVSLLTAARSDDEVVAAVLRSAAAADVPQERLSEGEVRALLDPTAYLGAGGLLVDEAVRCARETMEAPR